MKKALLLLILAITMTAGANAQVFTKILASAGLSTARAKAVENGLVEPQLVGVFTTNSATIDIGSEIFPIEFNLGTGLATSWAYLFVQKNDHTKLKVIAVVNSIITGGLFGMEANPTQVLESGYPIDLNTSIEGIAWVDSDAMAAEMIKDEQLKKLISEKTAITRIGFAYNNVDFAGVKDKNIWLVEVRNNNDKRTCVLTVPDKVKNCVDASIGVMEIAEKSEMSIYPNPAMNIINLKNAENISGTVSSSVLFDSFGREVGRLGEISSFDVSVLSAGMYYIRIIADKVYTVPFAVAK